MKLKIILPLLFSLGAWAQVIQTYGPDDQMLTDEEQTLSQEFVHEGIAQKIMQEECEGIEAECKGKDDDGTFLGIPNKMIELVGQAYTMLSGGMMGELKLSEKALEKARENDPMARDSKPDYCSKIPMATNLLAKFKQTSEQKNLKNLPAEGETVQKQELLKASASHKSRSETSAIQAGGYGATSACYIGMVAAAGVDVTAIVIKMPAAALLTAFHTTNAIRQKKIADKVKDIADKMPGRGYCNPITDRQCYCDTYRELKEDQEKLAEENKRNLEEAKAANTAKESTGDKVAAFFGVKKKKETHVNKVVIIDEAGAAKYCMPEIHDSNVADDSIRVSCLDEKMRLDPFCHCKTSNSCYDTAYMKFAADITPEMFAQSGLTDFRSMTRGELIGGRVGSAGFGRNAVRSKSLAKQYALQNPYKGDLSSDAMKRAQMAEDYFGIPKEMAAHLSSRPITAQDKANGKMLMAGATGGKKNPRMTTGKSGRTVRTLTFKPQRKSRRQVRAQPKDRTKLQRGKASASGDIIKFAEMAQAKAQINKRKDHSIFNVISRRYQLSGYKKLAPARDELD
ncbi:MAG: hypothetical protein DRQ88_01085 [Epsilonproteobacteria bacterium]|nr:MAG: hypothetical protein DRQ89_05150 [Campylobacterota bacterium]RLA67888.1 MAG: hypothetical protein DRQ88_01085 [Campylobacterota bacterium]